MAKVVYIICLTLGSYLVSWIATLFGAGYFSGWGILAGTLGAVVGIYVGYQINSNFIDG